MATTASGVTIPGASPTTTAATPIQDHWNNLGESLNGRLIVPVASVTARAALVAALAAEGFTPSAATPVYVDRADASAGLELERTIDGTTWAPLLGAWASYIPALTSSGTAPGLGTGNTVGDYIQTGKKIDGTVEVLWGVGCTPGTGYYVISMPVAANLHGLSALRVGTADLVRASTSAVVTASLMMINVGQAALVYSTGPTTAAGFASGSAPWAPANGDAYYARFSYEAA